MFAMLCAENSDMSMASATLDIISKSCAGFQIRGLDVDVGVQISGLDFSQYFRLSFPKGIRKMFFEVLLILPWDA